MSGSSTSATIQNPSSGRRASDAPSVESGEAADRRAEHERHDERGERERR